MKITLLSFVFLFAGMVHAEKAMDSAACANIAKACEGAGYKPGDHKKTGKGLWADCVHKIAKGETVEGVTATADEAKACMASKKEHKAEKAAKKAAKAGTAPATETPADPAHTN